MHTKFVKPVLSERKKRDASQQRVDLFIEYMIVTDTTIYNDNVRYAQTNDTNLVYLYMKAYYAHFANGVTILIFFF